MSSNKTKEAASQSHDNLWFLEGGGKMGQLMRNKDWTQTPLGNPEDWHISLKTMVSVMLNNPFGMHIAWGEAYTQLYNDGYIPILGENEHPDALGGLYQNTYPEIWEEVTKPMLNKVEQGESVAFSDYEIDLNRNGILQTCYFDFAYSPIFIENGKVGGILLTTIETTKRKAADLALKESNNQLAFAIEATELGTFDYNPATGTFSGNERLKAWFGLPPKSEILLEHAIEAISDKDKERVVQAINEALDYKSGGVYDVVYTIVHPVSGSERIVRAKGRAWFNEKKVAIRFNGTLQDITVTEKNARKVKQSERKLKLMIQQAPVAITILKGTEFRIERVNSKAIEIWGNHVEDMINKPFLEALPEMRNQGFDKLLNGVYETGHSFSAREMSIELFRNDKKTTRYIKFSLEPLYNLNNDVYGIMVVGIEVTDQVLARKKIEESDRKVRNVVENASFMIGLLTGKDLVIEIANQSIIDAWGKGNNVIGKRYFDLLPELREQKVFDQVQQVYKTGKPFHIINEPVSFFVNGVRTERYFNYDFIPLRNLSGEVYGIMISAIDVSDMILANRKIEEGEKRFRESVKQAPLGIAIFRGADFTTELVNDTYLEIVGRSEAKVLNKPLFKALPEIREVVEPLFHEVIASGESFHSTELPVYLKRGDSEELCYFNLVYHPLREPDNTISGIMIVATEITSSVKAKKDLELSELHFRTLVDRSPIAMAVLRGDEFVIEMANDQMLKVFWKKSAEEVVGQKILDIFPELIDQQFPALFKKVLETNLKYSDSEVRAFVRHGEELAEFYVDLEYAPLIELGGKVSGIIITAHDVTSKVAARKELELAEERIRLATEATELATWELSLNSKKLIHSARMAQIFGFEPELQLSQDQLRKQIVKSDLENIVKKAFKKSLKTGIYKYEARIVRTDGQLCWIRTHGNLFFDDEGKAERLIGTLRDITEEKRHQEDIEASEQKFRTLADSMPQFVWTSDKLGNMNYFNNSFLEYSQMELDDIVDGKWIRVIHPDDKEKNIRKWEKSIETGEDFLLEHRFLRHDGEYRWQLSRAIPQLDSQGNVLMWVGASADIHDMKEVDQQKDFFISMASHELKTPLTSIKGYVQILQSMYAERKDDFLKNSLNIMDRQINALTNLISDLLDLSKIKTGSLVLKKTTFPVNEFINELIDQMRQMNSNCVIIFNEIENREIVADRERMGQVLINFLTNAIKYSGDCDVEVKNSYEEEQLVVSVRDWGIGISKKDQKKIFERFYRVEGKNEETYPGFGIGLNIAAEIIERHKGEIGVESALGEGSTFYFKIPTSEN